MGKLQWEVWHSRPIQICQLCLPFYQRPNISDKFFSLASHFIRVQIFQIHLWGTKWMVVHITLSILILCFIPQLMLVTESESELINQILDYPAASKKWVEIFVESFFQTLDAIFSYKGVFFINVQKTNILAFIKTNFLTPLLSVKNTPFGFFVFSPPCTLIL